MCLDHTLYEYKKVRKYLPTHLVIPKVFKPKKGKGRKFNRESFKDNTREILSEE